MLTQDLISEKQTLDFLQFLYLTCQTSFDNFYGNILKKTRSLRTIGGLQNKQRQIGDFLISYFAKKLSVLAEVWISSPQRHGAGAYSEAFQLFRTHFLTIYWYLAEEHFSGKRLMHRLPSTIIFPKMLCLKYKVENLAEIYILLLFTHFYALLKKKINAYIALQGTTKEPLPQVKLGKT